METRIVGGKVGLDCVRPPGIWTLLGPIWAHVRRGQAPNANGAPSRSPRLARGAYLGLGEETPVG